MLCDQCIYYSYDEEYEEYVCGMDFADEDDYGRILQVIFENVHTLLWVTSIKSFTSESS